MKFYFFAFIFVYFIPQLLQAQLSEEEQWGEPVNLINLNSPADDFAPSWNKFQETLYFNSIRTGNSLFYKSSKIDSINFTKPELVKGEINKRNNNQSYIIFPSENTAYLSAFNLFPDRSYLNLYFSRLKKDEWTKPFPLDNLQTPFFTSHPALSPDGTTMVFSSTRESKYKDVDLYSAHIQENGIWGEVTPIHELNTPGNEITPFLASPDTLYFASDGQEGPGGYDLYISVFDNGKWQRPKPVYELNTEFNESDLVILPDKSVLFSSDRPGGSGGLDIYTAQAVQMKIESFANAFAELRIESAARSIKATNDILYVTMPLMPYVLPDKPSVTELDKFITVPYFNIPMRWTVDSVYYYSPAVIAKRLQDNPAATLDIIVVSEAAGDKDIMTIMSILNNTYRYLVNFWGIEKSRVNIIDYKEINGFKPGKFNDYLMLSSNDPAIFEPIEIRQNNIKLHPGNLDLEINALPKDFINNWKAELFYNDYKHGTIAEGKKLPVNLMINLNELSEEIYYSDSLVIKVTANIDDHQIAGKSYDLLISHSQIKQIKYEQLGENNYELYPVMLLDQSHLTIINSFSETIRIISEALYPTNYFIINYHNSTYRAVAETVSSLIKRRGNNVKSAINNSAQNAKFPQDQMLYIYIMKPVFEK